MVNRGAPHRTRRPIHPPIAPPTPRAHVVAVFLASAGLVGGAIGGWIGRIVLWGAHWFTMGENLLVNLIFGESDPGFVLLVIAVGVLALIVHDIWPKHSPKRRAVFLAGIAPVLMLAAGGQLASAITSGSFTAAPPAVVHVTSGNLHIPTSIGR